MNKKLLLELASTNLNIQILSWDKLYKFMEITNFNNFPLIIINKKEKIYNIFNWIFSAYKEFIDFNTILSWEKYNVINLNSYNSFWELNCNDLIDNDKDWKTDKFDANCWKAIFIHAWSWSIDNYNKIILLWWIPWYYIPYIYFIDKWKVYKNVANNVNLTWYNKLFKNVYWTWNKKFVIDNFFKKWDIKNIKIFKENILKNKNVNLINKLIKKHINWLLKWKYYDIFAWINLKNWIIHMYLPLETTKDVELKNYIINTFWSWYKFIEYKIIKNKILKNLK